SGDEADVFLVAAATRDSGEHLPTNDDRTGRVFVSQLRIGNPGIPNEFTGARVHCDHMCVIRGSEDLVCINGDVSLNASSFVAAPAGGPLRQARDGGLFGSTTVSSGRGRLRHFRAVLPDQVSRGAVQRLNNAARVGQVPRGVVN